MSMLFAGRGIEDVAALIAETPLCWVVPNAKPDTALLMPIVLEIDEAGAAKSLLGHLPRSAPATSALACDGAATFLWLGANAYISPTVAGQSDWGPTWNFASTKITGVVYLDDCLTRPALDALTRELEGKDGWAITELGSRYTKLADQVIGFRVEISAISPRFKLAQDERADVRASILAAFADTPVGRWMRRFAR